MSDKNWSSLRQRLKEKDAQTPRASTTKAQSQSKKSTPFDIEPIVAFYIFFASHILAAIYQPIQDCDEVFNYWEPTHYLNHRHGFQTWEYSPDYAIRSWSYAGLHAIVILIGKLFPFIPAPGKKAEFYFLRLMLAFACAVCEARLFGKVRRVLNERVAIFFMLVMTTSPGLFHASISYLPSSFAMYLTMLGTAAFLDWRGGLRTAQGIMFTGIGACLGWPFGIAMAVPFLMEELFLAILGGKKSLIDLFWRLTDGSVRVLAVLLGQTTIDDMLYKKFAVVPLNIVMYNVFSSSGGPDLYGTEPWHFYLRNLFLNFHVWLLLALVSLPLLLLQHMFSTKGTTRASYLRGIFILLPFYLWLAIFTLQPHKEERFMYPAYPSLALNAAMSLHIILANLGSTDSKDLIAKVPVKLRLFAVMSFIILSIDLSVFRILGTITAYSAPLAIYSPLHQPNVAREGDTLCLGKEWYRFPSHYHLPDGMRAKFIKSEFDGLLPGEFSEAQAGFGFYPGTWLTPPGMNDQNREDLGKYTDLRRCDWVVDGHLPSTTVSTLEPNLIADEARWEKMQCLPFLDAISTGIVGRLGWVPDLPFIPAKYKRVWGEYCLLRRKKSA